MPQLAIRRALALTPGWYADHPHESISGFYYCSVDGEAALLDADTGAVYFVEDKWYIPPGSIRSYKHSGVEYSFDIVDSQILSGDMSVHLPWKMDSYFMELFFTLLSTDSMGFTVAIFTYNMIIELTISI